MKFLRLSWWATPVISFSWVRARDLSIRTKYQHTLDKLTLISWLRGPDIRPMGQWTVEFYILQGHAYYQLDEKEKAKDRFEAAFQEMTEPNDYSKEEQNYLSHYVLSGHRDLGLDAGSIIAVDQIDLENIRPDLKMYYPLKAHPDWGRGNAE